MNIMQYVFWKAPNDASKKVANIKTRWIDRVEYFSYFNFEVDCDTLQLHRELKQTDKSIKVNTKSSNYSVDSWQGNELYR